MAQRKNKQAGKDQRARERARQRGQRRASRRNRPYLAWNHLTRDQKEVAKRIMAGDYRQIRHGGWGFLDKFLIFLKTIGFLQCLDVAGGGGVPAPPGPSENQTLLAWRGGRYT